MSKYIRVTDEYIEQCKSELEHSLRNTRFSDGKISFMKTFDCPKRNATVFFTAEAWAKMVMLLMSFNKEVAWHGVAERIGDEDYDNYLISDILVYPQEVTGSTVDMDVEKYATWLQDHEDDDRFYNIRMQGHSHVNMAVSPSGTDIEHQEAILDQLLANSFYIFMIYNKRFEKNVKIYDMKKNVLFENSDVEVKILDSTDSFDAFIKEAKEMVKERVYTTPTYQGGRGYQGWNQHGNGYPPYNPAQGNWNQQNPKPVVVTDSNTPKVAVTADAEKEKKGEQTTAKPDEKAPEKEKVRVGAGWKGNWSRDSYDEDYDDPYDYNAYSER